MNLAKKAVFLVLVTVLSIGMVFAGGGGQQQGAKGGGGPAGTINLWHIYADQTRGVPIEAAVRRFEAENPGIKVVISTNPNDPYKTKLKTVSGDDFPDVFHSWGGGWLKSFVDAGYVEDITTNVNAVISQLNPTAVNFNNFGGRIYGIPYVGGSTILYYNKDIFAKYNLKPPATWAELEKVCDTLIANKIIPFALANKTKWPGAQHFVLISMRLGGGDIFQQANDKRIKFTEDVFIRAGQMVQTMVDKGWFPTGANGLDWDTGQSRMLLYQEQCAMILQTSGLLSAMRQENADFYNKKLGIALYPSIEGGRGNATDILGGENAFSVSKNSKLKDMAIKLAIFLGTDTQTHQTFLNNGVMSSRPGLQSTDPLVKEALAQLENATFLQNYIDQTLSPELAEVHKDTTQALYGKTLTPQQAAQEMQRAFDAAN